MKRISIGVVVAGALASAGCDAGPRLSPPRLSNRVNAPGTPQRLGPMGLELVLPAGAKVEDLSQPGMPRRVNVTSLQPELIFDVEDVDELSPKHDEVLSLATRTPPRSERAELRADEQGDDGSFNVVVAHPTGTSNAGQLETFTVDMRVRVGSRLVDCGGTASSFEAAERLVQVCRAVRSI